MNPLFVMVMSRPLFTPNRMPLLIVQNVVYHVPAALHILLIVLALYVHGYFLLLALKKSIIFMSIGQMNWFLIFVIH